MSFEGRPHRAKRPTSRIPTTLTSSEPGPSNGGIRTGLAASKGKGKRNADTEEECQAEATEETKGLNGEVEKPKGKGRAANKSKSSTERLYDIDFMLTNPKSRLTGMDISDVINCGAWLALSPESRACLCKLLPRTAFGEQSQELDESHPSRRNLQENNSSTPYKIDDSVQTDQLAGSLDELAPVQEQHLDPSFFKDPHFESAVRTFQDHLFSRWFTPAHRELVERHHLGVRDGSLYAPWKDDLWDQDHPEDHSEADEEGSMQDPSDSIGIRNERRKSKESELSPLVRKGFLKQGDVISFRHKFIGCGLAIEKDALISAIHPKTIALTLTASSGTTRDLPSALLIPNPNGPADLSSLREMHVSTPTQLVTALLDIDGRIPREHRPRINAWKMITNWQWSVEMESQGISPEEAMLLDKGGRECLGTLFYLRGQALDD